MIGIVQNLIIATTYFVTDCALDFTFKFFLKKTSLPTRYALMIWLAKSLIFRLFSPFISYLQYHRRYSYYDVY